MNKILWMFFLIPILGIQAQTSTLLNGDIIRYHVNKTSSKNVFDNNPTTFMEATLASGSWVGLDLGDPYVITQIEFIAGTKNMQTGIFEASNFPDFRDASPLTLIKEATSNKMTYKIPVTVSKGFRYVRYVGANNSYCIINELKFYGYQSAGDDSKFYQVTNLPTVIINTQITDDEYADSKVEITSKEVYLTGNIAVVSDGGKLSHSDSITIKGRGNSSWTAPKKGYKVKLNSKAKLLNAPAKAKDWTLIASYADNTLLRSLLAFDISRKMGFYYTPFAQQIDLIVNGEYRGTYMLCDQIEINANRVNIDEPTPTDITEPNISGGYLLEIDAYAYDDKAAPVNSRFTSAKIKIPVTIKSPKDDKIVVAQRQYIENIFNSFESNLFAANYTDPSNGYRKYLDTKSFANYFVFEELVGNPDAFWSTYMIKKRNDNLLYTGPVWDFDLAFDNDSRVRPINSYKDFLSITKASSAGTPSPVAGYFDVNNANAYKNNMKEILLRLLTDPTFVNDLQNAWKTARENSGITREYLFKKITSLKNEAAESRKLNFVRWSITANTYLGSYDAEVNALVNYIYDRISWMDSKLGYVTNNFDDNFVYQPISIRGFNSDIVAENKPVDNYISRAITADHLVCYTPNIRVANALPEDGVLVSTKSNAIYKMAAYNTKQALLLKLNESAELIFDEVHNVNGISFLATSSDGNAKLNATINYTDGTSEIAVFSIDDWWTSTQKEAIANLGVVQAYNPAKEGNVVHTNFRLFEYRIMTDKFKNVRSITFKNTTTSRGFIFAVSKMVDPQQLRSVSFGSDIELNTNNSINIWPNPASSGDVIYIKSEGMSKIKLFNMGGSLVKETWSNSNSNLTELQTGSIQTGAYVLQISYSNGKTAGQTIIIK